MNNTIPFHPATHAPQITVDVNILTMLKQAASCLTEAAGKDVYLSLIHILQKLFQAFRRQVLRLHRNQGGVRRCQRIHGQHPKGRGAVQQDWKWLW